MYISEPRGIDGSSQIASDGTARTVEWRIKTVDELAIEMR
jgi:hypothetical protein